MEFHEQQLFLHIEKIMRIIRSIISKIRHSQRFLIENPSSFSSFYSPSFLEDLKDFFEFKDNDLEIFNSYIKNPTKSNKKILNFNSLHKNSKDSSRITQYRGLKHKKVKPSHSGSAAVLDNTSHKKFSDLAKTSQESYSSENESSDNIFYFGSKRRKERKVSINSSIIKPEDWFISPKKMQSNKNIKKLYCGKQSRAMNSNIKFITYNNVLQLKDSKEFNTKGKNEKHPILFSRKLVWKNFCNYKDDTNSEFIADSNLESLLDRFDQCFGVLWCDWVDSIVKHKSGNNILWGWENFISSRGISLKILASFHYAINIVDKYDPNTDIDKIENVYSTIPSYLNRYD
ncbi:hypothetical protein BB561_003903 [Smittium simulii]|uniref:Uncharacterized protein n=1 Tax=Smittium simulii TaxID=133385 RepID=A0A2T9YJ16_9FUNG|nr:hypothetical protein BB561_003903 [Smittium simulii]